MNDLTGHPSHDCLLAAAAGDEEQRRLVAAHAAECRQCQRRLARLLGQAEAVAEELLALRPGCPPPERLAEIPPGGEWDDPHVVDCPLCRQELDLIRALETDRLLGERWAGAPPVRPQQVVPHTSASIQDAEHTSIELDLQPGATASGRLAGTAITASVQTALVVIEVKEQPRDVLQAVLESAHLVRTISLCQGTTEVPRGSWQRLIIRVAGGGR